MKQRRPEAARSLRSEGAHNAIPGECVLRTESPLGLSRRVGNAFVLQHIGFLLLVPIFEARLRSKRIGRAPTRDCVIAVPNVVEICHVGEMVSSSSSAVVSVPVLSASPPPSTEGACAW